MIRIIDPSVKLLTPETHIAGMAERIKYAGCTCYQSYEDTHKTADEFIAMLIERGHLSVLEHESLSVSIICDRGVNHELVRHRIAAYSQESTRYCNYAGKPMEFIRPLWWQDVIECGEYTNEQIGDMVDFDTARLYDSNTKRVPSPYLWYLMMIGAQNSYNDMLAQGVTPQQARSVLPNSLKTEIVVTANLREWLHIFDLRTAKAAHPQMRQVMEMVKVEFQRVLPLFI